MKKSSLILTISLIIIVLAILIFGQAFLNLLLSIKEHVALGYFSIYKKELIISLSAQIGSAIIFLLFSLLSIRPYKPYVGKRLYLLFSFIFGLIGIMVGYGLGHIDPTTWLLFFKHQAFSHVDPIFHRDISFYVYVLPVLKGVIGKLVGSIFFFLFLNFVITLVLTGMNYLGDEQHIKIIRYLSRLIGTIFLLFAVNAFLGRYSLLYTAKKGNFLFGPSFTDTHITIPVTIPVQAILTLLIAIALFVFSFKKSADFYLLRLRTYKMILWPLGSLIGASIILSGITLGIERFYVHPNEQTVESPYIKHTIDETRWAMDINKIQTKPFAIENKMDNSLIDQNKDLLANVRINDMRQTKEIYNQLQSFKNYFIFKGASADRYNGQEVYIDVRQMDQKQLPVQTWINKNLVYTHGYGVAASPVNKFNDKGLPITIAQNTPQESQAPLPDITEPNIYFGLMNNEVIAPSKQAEFDYPLKSEDHNSHYKGGYNMPLQGNKLLLALEKKSIKFLTSAQFTPDSQFLFDRNIYDRVKDIAPFIKYDSDAYPFITDDGKVKWMMDAYTKSSSIPYGQDFDGTSYIRNSLKVVIDAYTGKVTYYVIDPKDPMIQSLMLVYPELFTTDIPADVSKHFRYPRDLFTLQSRAITTYHMTSSAAFYNQEDLWDIANEVYQQNQTQEREPVYQMIQMPGETKPAFVLSELFTPNNKMNLNGWFVASNEPDRYGELTLYQFPQKELFFGPMQAENQIDSDTDVSSQLTLWNQNGSHVVRGNLLLVPIGQTALYIEPIYLVAEREGALPQLQRVIIDYNEKVYMGTDLTDALRIMIHDLADNSGNTNNGNGETPNNNSKTNPDQTNNNNEQNGSATDTSAAIQDLVKQANQLLDQYKKDTASGDFAKAGQDMNRLQIILKQIEDRTQSK